MTEETSPLEELLILLLTDHGKYHEHICGMIDPTNPGDQPAAGCGHRWGHIENQLLSTAEYDRAHMCPQCGRGPWREKADHPNNKNTPVILAQESKK